jgi:hypothetical protein
VREYDALMLPGVQVGGAIAGDAGLAADRAVLAVPVIGVIPDQDAATAGLDRLAVCIEPDFPRDELPVLVLLLHRLLSPQRLADDCHKRRQRDNRFHVFTLPMTTILMHKIVSDSTRHDRRACIQKERIGIRKRMPALLYMRQSIVL